MKKSILNHIVSALFVTLIALFMVSCKPNPDNVKAEFTFPGEWEEHEGSEIYPDKEIIPINGEILAVIGGGIHCVTQQQPDFARLQY